MIVQWYSLKVPQSTIYCKKIACFLFLVNIQYHMSKWYLKSNCTNVLPQFSFLGVFFFFVVVVRVQCVTEASLLFCVFHLSNTGTNLNTFQIMKNKHKPFRAFYMEVLQSWSYKDCLRGGNDLLYCIQNRKTVRQTEHRGNTSMTTTESFIFGLLIWSVVHSEK